MANPSITTSQGAHVGQEGVWGFQGTSLEPRLVKGDINIFYVDSGHAVASDNNDGTDPDAPMATIQGLINRTIAANTGAAYLGVPLGNYDVIYVSGPVNEAVTITDYTTMASYVSLIGVGPSDFSPTWDSGGANDPCFVCGPVGWRISGFRFYVPANAAAVVVPCTQAPYGANAIGIRTIIDNNYFDGSVNTGLYGIDLHGAPYSVEIYNNKFAFMTAGGAFCIASTNTAYADAYRVRISGNWFHESVGGIDASLNVSLIDNNVFQPFGVHTMATVIDLRLGTRGENFVCKNCFGDADYSNVGGFFANAGAPGGWSGNSSEDVLEAEVGDNGWTIAPPT
jgi:hypothetical protein